MIPFSNINKQYGKQLLFVDASFQLNPGEKAGLVGPNGAGKTTLFRMVVGEETPDEGAVSVPRKFGGGVAQQRGARQHAWFRRRADIATASEWAARVFACSVVETLK